MILSSFGFNFRITPINAFGIIVALTGVLIYNLVSKSQEAAAKSAAEKNIQMHVINERALSPNKERMDESKEEMAILDAKKVNIESHDDLNSNASTA